MNRRNFATRLSLLTAALVPSSVFAKGPISTGGSGQGGKQVIGEGKDKGQAGVYGVNFHGGDGVSGQTDSGRGVWGESNNGTGVYGRSNVGKGYGVYGESKTNVGVYGAGNTGVSGAGSDTGVYGGGSKTGVYGVGKQGVLGVGDESVLGYGGSERAVGVKGVAKSQNGTGVYGIAQGPDTTAIVGDASGKGAWAARFHGNVVLGEKSNLHINDGSLNVSGKISKGGGAFKIDHPLAPAHKYLYHSFVESPDMMNIYNGNVTTDASGDAAVTLPAYFAALNRDYRYQLTVIGQFAQAIVACKIKDNRFTIKTDKPNVEVSWQVTGIRQDAWANAHRVQVEEAKPNKELGSYLHPELFGQPKEKSI